MGKQTRLAKEKLLDKKDYFVDWVRDNRFFVFSVIIILIFLTYNYLSGGILFTILNGDNTGLENFIASFGAFSSLVFVILCILEVVIAPLPSLVLFVTGGILFGTLWGGTLALIGNLIGSWIAFTLARKYARRGVEQIVNEKNLKAFDKYAHKYGGYAVFLLRVNPLTTSDLVSYIAGLSKMPLKDLLVGTFFGLLPLAFIQAYMGEGLIKDNPVLSLLFLLVSVIYISLFVYAIKNARKKYKEEKKN